MSEWGNVGMEKCTHQGLVTELSRATGLDSVLTMARMYRLHDHQLAIETGRHRQSWLPREDRLCSLCSRGEVETEGHFLLKCDKYKDIRASFFPKIKARYGDFDSTVDESSLQCVLGEQSRCSLLAAQYVWSCHQLRDSHRTEETRTSV